MRKRTLRIAFAFLFSAPLLLMAQNRQISGTVRNEKQEPVAGASVKTVGTSGGTSTNNDGIFTLTIPSSVKQIQFSAVGYAPQTLPVSTIGPALCCC